MSSVVLLLYANGTNPTAVWRSDVLEQSEGDTQFWRLVPVQSITPEEAKSESSNSCQKNDQIPVAQNSDKIVFEVAA